MAAMGTLQPEALVLAAIVREDGYAYQLSKRLKAAADAIEPALYTVLRRLKQEGLIDTYLMAEDGRVRKYYTATLTGRTRNEVNKMEWLAYRDAVCKVLDGR